MILNENELTRIYNDAVNTAKEKFEEEYNEIKELFNKEYRYFYIDIESELDEQLECNIRLETAKILNTYLLKKYRKNKIGSLKTFIELYSKSIECIIHKDVSKIIISANDLQSNCFADGIIRICNFTNIQSYIRFINKTYNLNIPLSIELFRHRELNTIHKIDNTYSYKVTNDTLELISLADFN